MGLPDIRNTACEIFDTLELAKKMGQNINNSKRDSFSILSQNIRSMSKNFENLYGVTQQVNKESKNSFLFSVIAVQETWKVKEVFHIPGYQKFVSKTRAEGNGGGIGFFVREGCEFEILKEPSIFEKRVHESMFIRIAGGNQGGIVIGNVYRPNTAPYASIRRSTEYLSKSIEYIQQKYRHDSIVILGDFNIDLLGEENNDTLDFISELVSKGFIELISVPTRESDSSKTLLDHIWVCSKFRSQTGVVCSGISDHHATFLSIEHKPKADKGPNTFQKREINSAKISMLEQNLVHTDWSSVTNEKNPVIAYKNFFQLFYKTFNMHCPVITKRIKNKRDIPLHPWMTKGLLVSRKRKEKLLKEKLKLKTEESKLKFYEYKRLYEKIIMNAKMTFYKREFESASGNSKKTWDILKEATKLGNKNVKPNFPSSFKKGEGMTKNTLEIANGFNEYFATVGSKIAQEIVKPDEKAEDFVGGSSKVFKFQEICRESIIVYASKLKNKHSAGWDGLSSHVLKQITPSLIDPLTHIFNLSLRTGYIPPEFKVSRVIPLYKDGEKDVFGNYRPISLLTSFSKLFEIIVNEQIRNYFNCFQLFSKNQFGFRLGSEPSMAVSKFVDAIFKAQNEISLGIFIDARKAFDTIDHNILLKKLHRYGFHGAEIRLVENYLKNRYQVTEINGEVSNLIRILAGVPQGSILGPLLFLIYINDLPKASAFSSFLFADDTSLHMSDKNLKNLEIRAGAELKLVERWFQANNMALNSKKTKYILFQVPNSCKNNMFELKLGGEILSRVSSTTEEKFVKLVGVALDENLSFKHHVKQIKVKLNRANFILAKSGKFLTQEIRVLVYNTLVKSVLEFSSWVYGNSGKTIINELFILQKKIVRNVMGVKRRVHTNSIFSKLGLLKLSDLIEYNTRVVGWKIWYGKAPENLIEGYEKTSLARNTRSSNDQNFKVPFCKKEKLKVASCYSVTNCWNKIDRQTKKIEKLGKFKRKLLSEYFDNYRSEKPCTIKNCYACSIAVM